MLCSASSPAHDFVREIPAERDSEVGCLPGPDAFPPGVVVLTITPDPDAFKKGRAARAQ